MYWYLNKNLSESDMELLAQTPTIESMMRNRVTVDFNEKKIPSFDDLNLEHTRDFYHIKIIGKHILQFWFNDKLDLEDFEHVLHEYKIKTPDNDAK